MPACLKCGSEKVIEGRIVGQRWEPVFRPKSLRFWSFSFNGGVFLSDKSFACPVCGLVWSSTPPDELSTFVKKHCRES
jgi:hypothetical protein